MSGGVDSSVSALLLKEQGYDVIGVTMKLFDGIVEGSCCNMDSTQDAKRVCDMIGIPHYTINMKEEFSKHVIDNFVDEYRNCRTPNPCIECNRYLKFDAMYKKAKELECDYIATGHYAISEFDSKYNRYVLKKAKNGLKDQSYVLYSIPKEIISKVLFPLGMFSSKDEVRAIASKNKLLVANKKDSQDICFIPDGNYKKFLEDNFDFKENIGDIVSIDGNVLGKHKGLYRYTIGQRKGLGVSYKYPLFIKDFDKKHNRLIVARKEEIYSSEFFVNDINLLLFDKITNKMEVLVKVRYLGKLENATIEMIDEDIIKVVLKRPMARITRGQSAVFYINDIVIGGGKII